MSNQPDLFFFNLPLLSKQQKKKKKGQKWFLFVHKIIDLSVILHFFQSNLLMLLHIKLESWKAENLYECSSRILYSFITILAGASKE